MIQKLFQPRSTKISPFHSRSLPTQTRHFLLTRADSMSISLLAPRGMAEPSPRQRRVRTPRPFTVPPSFAMKACSASRTRRTYFGAVVT